MYALQVCSKASVSRCVLRTLSSSRASYTDIANTPERSEPTSASSKLSSGARIASSWGDVVIPSREEILRNENQSKGRAYTPDLSYLAADKSSSLASRLAAGSQPTRLPTLDSVQVLSQRLDQKPSLSQNLNSSSRKVESLEERNARLKALTDARRAERQARQAEAEAAKTAQQNDAAARRAYLEEAARAASEKVSHLTAQRTVQRLKREAMDYRQPKSRIGRTPQRQAERGRGSPKTQPGMKTRSSGPKKPQYQVRISPSQDSQVANERDDITWEIVEAGGDEKEPPQFTNPDISFTNLDDLFQPTLEQRVEDAVRTSRSVSLRKGQIQKLLNSYAGDYQRLAPYTSQDFATPAHELNPLKHANLILSQKRGMSIGAKKSAVFIIASAVEGITGAQDVQAVVN